MPEQIPRDEYLGLVSKQQLQIFLNGDDSAELLGIVGHGLSIAAGVDDGGEIGGRYHGDHSYRKVYPWYRVFRVREARQSFE